MRASVGTDESGPCDPWEVFSALMLLVVEGRTPGGDKGYHAGPHCPSAAFAPAQHKGVQQHICNNDTPVCARACSLLRQLRVMWGAGVGVSIEVLIAPECEHGAQLAATLDTTTAPRPQLKLVEHWSFNINHNRSSSSGMGGWSLVAAVRSFLHFSQLSAWLSRSEGRRPGNVLYRLTVTSPVFCSKHDGQLEEHVFPLASVGSQTSIQVSVKSMPRKEEIPIAICSEPHGELLPAQCINPATRSVSFASTPASGIRSTTSSTILTSSPAASPATSILSSRNSQTVPQVASEKNGSSYRASYSHLAPGMDKGSNNTYKESSTFISQTVSEEEGSDESNESCGVCSIRESVSAHNGANVPLNVDTQSTAQSYLSPPSTSLLPTGVETDSFFVTADQKQLQNLGAKSFLDLVNDPPSLNGSSASNDDDDAISNVSSEGDGSPPKTIICSQISQSPKISILGSGSCLPSLCTCTANRSDQPMINVDDKNPTSTLPATTSHNVARITPETSLEPVVGNSSVSQQTVFSLAPSVMGASQTSVPTIPSTTSINSTGTALPSVSSSSSVSTSSSGICATSTLESVPHELLSSSSRAVKSPCSPAAPTITSASNERIQAHLTADHSGDIVHTVKSNKSDDLRVCVMRAQLEESSSSSRGSSPDMIQLGESLLDPPHAASRIPRCYQSPSRSGSPSRETPEHIICRPRHYSLSEMRSSSSNVAAAVPAAAAANGSHGYTGAMSGVSYSNGAASAANGAAIDRVCADGCKPITPHVIIGRTTNPGCYNPMAWTQSKYPAASTGHHHHMPYHQHYYPHHHHQQQHRSYDPNQQHHHHSDNQSHDFLTHPHESESQNKHQPIKLHSDAANEDDCTRQNIFKKSCQSDLKHKLQENTYQDLEEKINYQHSSQESLENLRNIQKNDSHNSTTHYSSSPGFSSPQPNAPGSHKLHYSNKFNDLNDLDAQRSKLKLDLSQIGQHNPPAVSNDSQKSAGSGKSRPSIFDSSIWDLMDDDLLPPDKWSPRSRNLLLQHIGSGGTKRKVDSWEESVILTANKGRRKENHNQLVNSNSGKMGTNDEHSGNNVPNFELTPKETLEILSVLHRRNPAVQPPREQQQHLVYHCNTKQSTAVGIQNNSLFKSPPQSSNFDSEDSNLEGFRNGKKTLSSSDNSWTGNYRCVRDVVNSDSEDDDSRNTDNEDGEEQQDLTCTNSSSDVSFVEATTVVSKTQLYRASSVAVNRSYELNKSQPPRNVYNSNGCFSSKSQTSKMEKGKISDINCQVASIGDRVRRTLNFDRENYDSSSNGFSDSSSNGTSNGRSHPQSNLFKSLMKRSYQVCSESSFSNCKQAKGEFIESNGSYHAVSLSESNGYGNNEGNATPTKNLCRPDSPATLLGDEEVAQIISEATTSTPLSGAINIPATTDGQKKMMRSSLDSASDLVFHFKTGLPLTSSPAPLRKAGSRFDYDSTLSSVAAIKRSTSFHSSAYSNTARVQDVSSECDCVINIDSDCESNDGNVHITNGNGAMCTGACRTTLYSASAPATITSSNLLGTFEECVLHGRIEPVSTVQGFKAEIAASGSFCPEHVVKPVTVFFYTLCDNDHFSSPYLGHIRLEKKGYRVPNRGTMQVTLLNPLGTVVKMFVVMYDMNDMPPNSRTFLRQRTLNMPMGASDQDPDAHQWLRYLIHLKFASSKSGKVYLHTDIRLLIFRKSDADAAALHKTGTPYELRSFTHGPSNPKYSPRK